MYTDIHFQFTNDNTVTVYFYVVLWRHAEIRFADHRWRRASHVVLWQFSKEIINQKNGSTVFKIFMVDPKYLCFDGAKKKLT